MRVEIRRGSAVGSLTAPPSKSILHRLLICAGLADGVSLIENTADSDDMAATVGCLSALGVGITQTNSASEVVGVGGKLGYPNGVPTLDCRESGSTLRFMIPLCLLDGRPRRLVGSRRLFERPLGVYERICSEQGLIFDKCDSELTLAGVLKAGEYTVDVSLSSQFISGLMFTLPLLDGDSVVATDTRPVSFPYIEMTAKALSEFGISVYFEGNRLIIPGRQRYKPCNPTVEGDWSNSAFFEALNLIGGRVTVCGLDPDSCQGDKIYRSFFEILKSGGEAVFDVSDCPDLAPILMAMGSVYGCTRLIGTRRLKYKESRRDTAMAGELEAFGVRCKVGENEITVSGKPKTPCRVLDGCGDHRIVMALSVLLTLTGGEINNAEVVTKSCPDFFDRLKSLGIGVTVK